MLALPRASTMQSHELLACLRLRRSGRRFMRFSHHLGEMTPVQANEAPYAVMSGQPDASAEAVAAFGHALRAMMLVPASSAALAGLTGWLWIEPTSARV
jgi:hypothetical protein